MMTTLVGLTTVALAFAGCRTAHEPDNAEVEEPLFGPDLAQAHSELAFRRMARINALRAEHAVIATQPNLISTMAQNFGLTDDGRALVDEKLSYFQMHLDETKNLI